jgi:hypothetical protein
LKSYIFKVFNFHEDAAATGDIFRSRNAPFELATVRFFERKMDSVATRPQISVAKHFLELISVCNHILIRQPLQFRRKKENKPKIYKLVFKLFSLCEPA